MEWESYHVKTPINRKAEIVKWRNNKSKNEEVVECCMRSTVFYMAVKVIKNGRKHTQAEIFATSIGQDYDNFSFQHYIETENPMYRKCPKKILNLLSETDDEKALLWRAKCREENEKNRRIKDDVNSLKNLPLHTLIEINENIQKKIILEKSFFRELKRPVWVNWQKWVKYEEKEIYAKGYSVIRRGGKNES